MRRIRRTALPSAAQSYLEKRQLAADSQRSEGKLDSDAHWESTRPSKSFKPVLTTLQAMMGSRQRCMYCLDSHGSDIEHFRPKAAYPQRMYDWGNLLLCCTECGRFKGSQFPRKGRQALLIDPTREDPWRYLDFDPVTGNICARFDLQLNDWSVKGIKTVEVLQLDRREALSAGYLQTLHRLGGIVEAALAEGTIAAPDLIAQLNNADDHGLLAWCLSDRGQAIHPFNALYQQYPNIWKQCRKAV